MLVSLGLAATNSSLLVTAHGASGPALVGAPKAGKTYRAGGSVPLRIHAGPRDEVSARLNGEAITHELNPPHGSARRMRLSASHGLRHGRNVVRVVVRQFHGGQRARRVRFRIAGRRPLASAGRDLTVAPGARVRLDGTDSRRHPRARGRLRYRWDLVAGPSGSNGDGDAARLQGRRSTRPTFRPAALGTHRLRLRVTAPDGAIGRDRVELRADPPPVLEVNTMAEDGGAWGIRVGDRHYAATPGSWLQVVVLDRSLGTLKSNKSYPCPDISHDGLTACVRTVHADVSKLSDNDLVIASNQPEAGGTSQAPNLAGEALDPLGPPGQTYPADPSNLVRGTYSAIGTIGGPTTAHSAAANTPGDGAIEGLLIRNNRLNYSFASPDGVAFDTQAEGSSATANVIKVGGHEYQATVSGSPGGFHVVVVDAATLQGTSHWFATGGATGNAAVNLITSMHEVLEQALLGSRKLVFLASRGKPTLAPNAYDGLPSSHTLYHAIRDTAATLERLGGTRGPFYRLIDPGLYEHESYTLLGGGPTVVATGEAAVGKDASDASGSLNALPLGGTLTRTADDYRFELGQAFNGVPIPTHSVRSPGQRLVATVYGPETLWPDEGKPGREAAIAFVGNHPQVGLTDDPRSQYYTRPFTPESWQATRAAIASLQPGQLPANVTQDDFDWAKQELATEIEWLILAHSYVGALAAPYQQIELRSWADLSAIAEEINDEVKAAPQDTVLMVAGAVFDGARALTEAIPEVGEAFAALNAIYDAALEIAEATGGEQEDPKAEFRTTVAKAGSDLADRLYDGEATLNLSYANAIAADYEKLRTVALCGQGSGNCQDPDDWQITQSDQVEIGKSLRGSLRNTFYSTLLPARYVLWRIPDVKQVRDATKWVGAGALGFGTFRPFGSSPPSAQLAVPICRDMNDHDRDEWQVYALGSRTGEGTVTNPWKMEVPSAAVTDHLFEPVNPSQFPEGPLGNDREVFYLSSFHQEPISHFPLATSDMFWDVAPSVLPYCSSD